MRFENAYSGIKKVYAAEIVALIGSIMIVVMTIMRLIGLETAGVGTYITSLGMMAANWLPTIAYIIMLIGFKKAKIEENSFKHAFRLALVNLIWTILAGMVQKWSFLTNYTAIISSVFSLLVTIFVIRGLKRLSLNAEESTFMYSKLNIVVLITLSVLLVARIVCTFWLPINAGTFNLMTSVLTVVFYLCYVIYLGQAKNMLKL